jgi:hypothetical protein
MIADLLRCHLLPECYMAPVAMRDLRRVLRCRNLVVRQATWMKNRIAGPLMETGTPYTKGTAAWQGVLQRVVREFAGGASLGGGTAPTQSGDSWSFSLRFSGAY